MTTPAPRPDRLLQGTRLLLTITMCIAALATIVQLAAIPAVWIFSDQIIAAAARHHIRLAGNESLAAITLLLFGALVLAGLAVLFLRKLIAFIDSLQQGSPFIPENAARLRAMGWIVLAMQGLALLAVPVAVWMRQVLHDDHFIFSVSLEGLITALLLFILARVFDQGIKLAEDVEGTV